MHQSDTETQRVTHSGVFDPLEMRRQILGLASKEFVGLSVRGGKGEKVERRKLGMLASGHKHDGRLALGRVLADRTVHGSRHRLHARLEIDDVNALDVDVQRHGSDARREVEHPVGRRTNPLPEIPRIRQGGAQTHDTDGLLQLGADVSHAAGHDFHRGADRTADQVQLVRDEERDVLRSCVASIVG